MSDWQNTAAGAGLTGGLIALMWGAGKLFKRSRCSSHNQCCDFDISRAETQRQKKIEDLEAIVLQILDRDKRNDDKDSDVARAGTPPRLDRVHDV